MADDKKDSKKLERIYTVNLSKAYEYLRTRRTERAVVLLRAFLARHFKVRPEAVSISEGVNSTLWRDSIQKPPRRIKIRGVLEDGTLKAWLIGEEEALAKKKSADEKAKKEKEEKKGKSTSKKTDEKKEDKSSSKPAEAKPSGKGAESKPAEKETPAAPASPALKASDVKPMSKTSGAISGGRNQI